jgi:hypothetical protein
MALDAVARRRLDGLSNEELDALIVKIANEDWENEAFQDAYLDELIDYANERSAKGSIKTP